MVTISLHIEVGARTLRSCSHCDIREWETEVGQTTLGGVLEDIAEVA